MKRIGESVREFFYWLCGTDGVAAGLLLAVVAIWRGGCWVLSKAKWW